MDPVRLTKSILDRIDTTRRVYIRRGSDTPLETTSDQLSERQVKELNQQGSHMQLVVKLSPDNEKHAPLLHHLDPQFFISNVHMNDRLTEVRLWSHDQSLIAIKATKGQRLTARSGTIELVLKGGKSPYRMSLSAPFDLDLPSGKITLRLHP